MLKFTSAALVAALAVSPAAFAEDTTPVTLIHTYETALVSSDEGASRLLADLTRAAERVCSSRVPASGSLRLDKACAAGLVESAVAKIRDTEMQNGAVIAPALERIGVTQLASAE